MTRDVCQSSYRTRRWRTLAALAVVLAEWTSGVEAQTSLNSGAAVRFEINSSQTASFQLPVAAASGRGVKTVYSVTLNVCSPPSLTAQLTALDTQAVLFISTTTTPSRGNPSSAGTSGIARGGFANVTLTVGNNGAPNGLFVGVTAPDQPSGSWTFELAATTGSPIHVIDQFPLLSLDDTDNATALLTSATYFPSLGQTPQHDLLVMQTSSSIVPPQLSLSSCYLRTLRGQSPSPFLATTAIQTSVTTRGVALLGASEGGTGTDRQQAQAGGQRTQYLLSGLSKASNYTLWGLDASTTAGSTVRLYQPQYFRTKTGAYVHHDVT